MTTRAQLESEREALLSLSDEQADHACDFLRHRARAHDENAAYQRQMAHVTRGLARALRTVADLIRREPRGDV